MKYYLHINQAKAIELGIKNINQAHVFDLLISASSWATPININDRLFYWVSRQKICKELELLSFKPDTVYRLLKFLANIKLIDYGMKFIIISKTINNYMSPELAKK